MPRGRQINYDKRITDLIGQLKAAIVARERVEMEARVAAQLGSLLNGLSSMAPAPAKASAPAAKKRSQRKPVSAAQRKAVGARMKKFWAERRKQKAAKD